MPGGAASNRQDPISGCREAIVGGAPETQSAQATIGAAYDRQSAVPRSKSCSRIFMHRSRGFSGTVRQCHPIVRRRTNERSRELGQSLFCTRQMVGNNLHNCAECYPTKKRGHIVGPHSDATVAGWAPDHFLLGRAVNVNASAESMRVGHLQTAQPD